MIYKGFSGVSVLEVREQLFVGVEAQPECSFVGNRKLMIHAGNWKLIDTNNMELSWFLLSEARVSLLFTYTSSFMFRNTSFNGKV